MNARLFFKRHASTILTGIGAIGVVATSVMAVKATPKALKKIEEAEKEKGDELSKWEVVQVAGTTYVPSILIGMTTLSCIVGANLLNRRQQAALISAYGLLDQSFRDYKRKLIELHGKETHDEVVKALAIEKAEDIVIRSECMLTNCTLSLEEACGDPVVFYDEFSNRYFETTIEQVQNAIYHTNRNFILRGFVVLNEFYEFLGLTPTDYGSTVGWDIESEIYWIDFTFNKVKIDDDLECYIIETPFGPSMDYAENW